MVKIAIGDWFLARSDAFRVLLSKFRDHKINTQRSFSKVKQTHRIHGGRFKEHDARIRKLEVLLKNMESPPLIIRKKK